MNEIPPEAFRMPSFRFSSRFNDPQVAIKARVAELEAAQEAERSLRQLKSLDSTKSKETHADCKNKREAIDTAFALYRKQKKRAPDIEIDWPRYMKARFLITSSLRRA
jgi:hypothetical protein